MSRPERGDFGLVGRGGPFGVRVVGWWINFGQALIGDSSRYVHALIYTGPWMGFEARPGGAGPVALSEYEGRDILWSHLPLTDEQRDLIVVAASNLVGTPYSFLDYLALAMDHWGIRPKWLRRYVASKQHMICSQLVDEVYRRAGVQLFDDGRDPQDVTPGDLMYVLYEKMEGS